MLLRCIGGAIGIATGDGIAIGIALTGDGITRVPIGAGVGAGGGETGLISRRCPSRMQHLSSTDHDGGKRRVAIASITAQQNER